MPAAIWEVAGRPSMHPASYVLPCAAKSAYLTTVGQRFVRSLSEVGQRLVRSWSEVGLGWSEVGQVGRKLSWPTGQCYF